MATFCQTVRVANSVKPQEKTSVGPADNWYTTCQMLTDWLDNVPSYYQLTCRSATATLRLL
jgi:hypothetical protein